MDSYGNFATFSCSLFSQILYCLKLILNIQNNVFADFPFFVQFWGFNFQTVYQIYAYDMALESCWLGANYSCRTFFQILYGLGADLKIRDSAFRFSLFFVLFFGAYFWTTCRNVPNDIVLKRYWLGATFSCWTFFEILNGLSLIFEIHKSGDNADTRTFWNWFI